MSRHASAEELARYAEGDLKPRKAARIAAHLAVCALCGEQRQELRTVSALLANVHFPSMPEHLCARIEMAIASESVARVAREPATEAGRRDLPARAQPARRGWRLPGLSSPRALRLVAAAGAALVVAGGGYEMATHIGSNGAATSSSSSNAAGVPLRLGPSFGVQRAGRLDHVQAVEASTNFTPGSFKTEALSALNSEKATINHGAAHGTASAGLPKQSFSPASPVASPAPDVGRLQGCVGLIAAGRNLLLVELAKYLGGPATIIIVGPASNGSIEAYAVGPGCSASSKNILFRIALPHL
jgi:hypothetical protein